MVDSFRRFMKKKTTGMLWTDNNFLTEEECRDLYLYIKNTGYYRQGNNKYFSGGTTRVEFATAFGGYAHLDMNPVIKEACFYEYSNDKKRLTSITNFSSRERLDIIGSGNRKSYLHTINHYKISLYYDEEASSRIRFKYIHADEVPDEVEPTSGSINKESEGYERIISAKNHAANMQIIKRVTRKSK